MSLLKKPTISKVARLAGAAMLVAAGCMASWIGSACAPGSAMRGGAEDDYEQSYQRARAI